MPTAEFWIDHLQLTPHPEGGYYRETYRAVESISKEALPARYTGDRHFSTAIYFLLKSGQVSHLHRLQTDEVWHFYHGCGLTLHIITPDGDYTRQHLGADAQAGQHFQCMVAAGCWFGATVDDADAFALVGCTMAPGFDFADFEMGHRARLLELFPQHKTIIERLTIPKNE